LHFRIAGFPVRVHPFFWLMTLLMGARSEDPMMLLIWIVVVFLSILVHELGHALTMRYYGQDARIVLYMMGGLAIPESSWGGSRGGRKRGRWAQILISAAGPGAGFLLAGLVVAMVLAGGGVVRLFMVHGFLPVLAAYLPDQANEYGLDFVNSLLWVNVFWGLLNLMPVNPLDGGQIAREVLTASDPWEGMAKSLWLSVFVGAAVAVVGLVVLQDRFLGIFFAMLAFSNYMAIQNLRGRDW
jgi:Zn-dependent protease